ADTRAAWDGPLSTAHGADAPIRVRVEASAYRNQPVSFTIVGPWSRATRMQPPAPSSRNAIATAILAVVAIALTIGAAFLARHNFRVGRADAAGATKLAIVGFSVEICAWIFGFQHVADVGGELNSLNALVADAALASMTLWFLYAALEPYCRRFWPDILL